MPREYTIDDLLEQNYITDVQLASALKNGDAVIKSSTPGGMTQYRLTITSGRNAHFVAPDGSTMTFDDVKSAVLDASKFVFLDHASCYHIPCFVVDEEGNEAIGFTSAFSVDDKPHIERIAINQNGTINSHNYSLVAYDNDGDVIIKGPDSKDNFVVGPDGKIYVIGLGGYDGTNRSSALSLQELFGVSNIQAASNKSVSGYMVPNLTPDQVAQAYNLVVAGRGVTITDADGNYHLSVMQADVLNGDLAISIIYLNVALVTYEITGDHVDIHLKTL